MLKFILVFGLMAVLAFAEAPEATGRKLVLLPSSDATENGLGESLQYGLGVLFQETGRFQVFSSPQIISGFTVDSVQTAFTSTGGDAMSFAYLENNRISIFLFDTVRPQEYLVSSASLADAPAGQLDNAFIEARFREAFTSLLQSYDKGKFEPLPGSHVAEQKISDNERKDRIARAEESRALFRELASLSPSSLYMGAGVGMSRFAGHGNAASTVNFGGLVGYQFSPRWNAELGVDIFSYAVVHAGPRYLLPVAEKQVALHLGADLATVAGRVTSNQGNASSAMIDTGAFLFGPALTFDIPLLGATLRGDIRAYIGDATVLVGTYGVVYNL